MTIDKKDFISFITIKQSLSEQSIRHCTIRIGVINSPYALTIERKGENNPKTERLFNMFLNKTSREGIHGGKQWLHWMYTYLPENERKVMNNRVKNSKEMEMPGVPKEKIVEAKEGLLKSLEDFSKKRDNDFKKIYSKETPLERKKTLMENQSSVEIVEKAFNGWKERENKFKEAPTDERLKMWFEEMGPGEIGGWKKRVARLIEVVGAENIEQIRPFGEAISKNEKDEKEIEKKLWGRNKILGEREAQREEEREGKPVVFLGDVEANIKKQLKDWFYEGLHKEELEEEVEEIKAGAGYTERIIGEIEEKEKRQLYTLTT